ncbi:unnamed protein product [Caenorhabditis brenneri]
MSDDDDVEALEKLLVSGDESTPTTSPQKEKKCSVKKDECSKKRPVLIDDINDNDPRKDHLNPRKLIDGRVRWQERLKPYHRMDNIREIVTNVHIPQENVRHKRMPMLLWFARRMEQMIFRTSASVSIYECGMHKISTEISNAIERNAELKKIRDEHGIPDQKQLEKLFAMNGPSDSFPEDDDLNAEGAPELTLISDDRFRHHKLVLEKQLNAPPIEPKNRKQIRRNQQNRTIVLCSFRRAVENETMMISITPCRVDNSE